MSFSAYLSTYLLFHLFSFLDQAFRHLIQLARSSLLLGTATDLALSKAKLIAENALLRHQLIVLRRQVKKPRVSTTERFWFPPGQSPASQERCLANLLASGQDSSTVRPMESHLFFCPADKIARV